MTTMREVPVGKIKRLENPRSQFDPGKMEELKASIEKSGILQPLLLRPAGDSFELVAGERRFRAAKELEMKTVPALIRDISDEDVAEARIIENLQREDLSALDEAEAYARLMKEHKWTSAQLADRLGKTKAYIYARRKLCDLPAQAKNAMRKGELPQSHALLLARLPKAVAVQVLKTILITSWSEAHGKRMRRVMSYRSTQDVIRKKFARSIRKAPWDLGDKSFTKKPACDGCAKRLSADGEICPDGADVCTDLSCWSAKEKEHAKRIIDSEREKGVRVLTAQERKKVMPFGSDYVQGGFINIDGNTFVERDKRGRPKKWKSVIGKVPPEKLAVACTPEGKVVRLMKESDAISIAKANGKEWAKRPKRTHAVDPSEVKRRQEGKVRRRSIQNAIAEIVEGSGSWPWTSTQLVVLCEAAWGEVHSETCKAICRRRGWETTRNGSRWEEVSEFVQSLPAEELPSLLVEILISPALEYSSWELSPFFPRVAEAFEVNYEKHRKEAEKELAPKSKKRKETR